MRIKVNPWPSTTLWKMSRKNRQESRTNLSNLLRDIRHVSDNRSTGGRFKINRLLCDLESDALKRKVKLHQLHSVMIFPVSIDRSEQNNLSAQHGTLNIATFLQTEGLFEVSRASLPLIQRQSPVENP